jgi:glutamine synthetase
MPKPFIGESGNGMHIHMSLLDKDDRNIFDNGQEEGSDLMQQAVAGMLKHMRDCTLIFAPHINSYRRLEPGVHAPTYPGWGYENRTVALRIPTGSNKARRIEHRVAGAETNPYLVLAAILAAAWDGLTNNLTPPPPVTGDGYAQTIDPLPIHIHEAVDIFRASNFVADSLSPELRRHIALTKEQEILEFRRYISAMEYQTYLQY